MKKSVAIFSCQSLLLCTSVPNDITSIMNSGNSQYVILPKPSLLLLCPDDMTPHIAGFDVRGPSGSHSTMKTAVNMLK